MTTERPSKYHRSGYVGEGVEGADKNGFKYSWDSSHEDLTNTKTVQIGSTDVCVYCAGRAYPIQAGLRESRRRHILTSYENRDYSTTGYTCICDGAEAEREYTKELKEIERAAKQALEEKKEALKEKFGAQLTIDVSALTAIRHRHEASRRDKTSSFFFFRDEF